METIAQKIIVVGDIGTGKTTFLNRLSTAVFTTEHNHTLHSDPIVLKFITGRQTKRGIINFKCYEIPDSLDNEHNNLFDGAQACLIFYDCSDQKTYKNIPKYIEKVRKLCNNIPIVLCGNKGDLRDKIRRPEKLPYLNTWEVIISAKSNYNIQKPFLWLARKMNNNPNLYFSGAESNSEGEDEEQEQEQEREVID